MQAEILAANPQSRIRLAAVNNAASAGSAALAVDGRTIQFLQDPDDGVWISWAPAYRDVVILDGENRRVAVFGLMAHDLYVPSDYAALLALLRSTAGE